MSVLICQMTLPNIGEAHVSVHMETIPVNTTRYARSFQPVHTAVPESPPVDPQSHSQIGGWWTEHLPPLPQLEAVSQDWLRRRYTHSNKPHM